MLFSAGLTCAQFPDGKLLSQAEADFSRALKLRSNSCEALYNLGLVFYWQGKFQEARVRFDAVLQVAPTDPWARKMADLLKGSADG